MPRPYGKKGALPDDPSQPRINLTPAIRGTAPTQAHWGWIPLIGMEGNDDWGDCVDAGGAHLAEAWSFWGQGTETEITTDQTLAMYAKVGHFDINAGPPGNNPTDNGSTLQAGLKYLNKTGLAGIKAAAYGQLDKADTNAWQQCLAEIGPLMLGVGVGDAEQTAFSNGATWVVQPQANPEDHCIILCGYQANAYFCWTWGGLQAMTPGWFEQNVYEVWGVASQEWVNAVKGTDPTGVDLAVFGQEYAAITGKPDPFAA